MLKPKSAVQADLAAVPCLFLAATAALFYNPLLGTYPDSAGGTMGFGLVNGISIDKLVVHFFLWYIGIFLLLFVGLFWLFGVLARRAAWGAEEYSQRSKAMSMLAVLGLPLLVIEYIGRLSGESAKLACPTVPLLVSTIILEYFVSHIICALRKRTPPEPEHLIFLWAASFLLAFPLSHLLGLLGIQWPGYLWVMSFALASGLGLCAAGIAGVRMRWFDTTARVVLPLCFAPVLTALYLEGRNILAQHGIVLRHPQWHIMGIYVLLLGCAALIYLCGRKKSEAFPNWKRVYYPLILVSVLVIAYLPQAVVHSGELDYFEHANQGVPLLQMVTYGKLPIIESFSAHVLSDFIGPLTYFLVNGDMVTAVFAGSGWASPLLFYDVFACVLAPLSLFFILKTSFNADFALGFSILFPIAASAFGAMPVALSCVTALIHLLKRPGWKACLLYALTLAFNCLYRLDYGAAFALATFAALVILWLLERDRRPFKMHTLLLCLAGTAFTLFVMFVTVCTAKGIQPVLRLRELLAQVTSNGYWAFGGPGSPETSAYPFFYILAPMAAVVLLVGVVYLARNRLLILQPAILGIILSLGFAFVANIPRIMVRHNVAEGWIVPLMFMLPLFFAFAAAVLAPRAKQALFVLVCFGVMLAGQGSLSTQILAGDSYIGLAAERYTEEDTFNAKLEPYTERFRWDNETEIVEATRFIESALDEGETFIDLSAHGMLYVLTGRECPYYVSQAPALLSDEFLQQQFIAQVDGYADGTPLAVTSMKYTGLDGIAYSDRQHLVYEYLYNEYVPLVTIDTFVFWCRGEKLDEYTALADNMGYTAPTQADMRYLMVEDVALGEMPYLWGLDGLGDSAAEVLIAGVPASTGIAQAPVDMTANGGTTYLRLEIESASVQTGVLELYGEDGPLKKYTFNIHEGVHTYLFRVSSNWFWHSGEVDTLFLSGLHDAANYEIALAL